MFAFKIYSFLPRPPLFRVLAVYPRPDSGLLPGPSLRIMAIDVVLNLLHRQPQPLSQIRRPHCGVPPPDNRPVLSLAEPPLRLLAIFPAVFHDGMC